jgi:trimeric autotransporter adhesin
MISEMERLILKADVVASEVTPTKGKILARKKGFGVPPGGFAFGSKTDASRIATSITANGKTGKSPIKTPHIEKSSNIKPEPAPEPTSTPLPSPSPSPMGLLSAAARLWEIAGTDTEPADSETTKESVSAACSDNTSVDDFFDSTTTLDSEDPAKMTLKKESSLVHKLYMKRPIGLSNMTESEYSNAIDPPEDCKSAHPVAKEYIKAISTTAVNTPPRGLGKIVSTSSTEALKVAPSPRNSHSHSLSHSHAESTKKSTTPMKPGPRKFGFIPSPSFTKSLSKVTKDAERSSNSNPVRRSSTIGSNTTSRDIHDTDGDTHDGASVDNHNRRTSMMSECSRGDGSEASSDVLFGVSQMLNLLKKHIEKSRYELISDFYLSVFLSLSLSPPLSLLFSPCLHHSSVPQCLSDHFLSYHTSPLCSGLDSATKKKPASLNTDGSTVFSPSSSQRNVLTFLPSHSGDGNRHPMPFLQASGYVEDELNRRMFNADERAYLLEEIEKKDNMLSMLTEGLREASPQSVLPCCALPYAVLYCATVLSLPLYISLRNCYMNLNCSLLFPPLHSPRLLHPL